MLSTITVGYLQKELNVEPPPPQRILQLVGSPTIIVET